MYQKSYRKRPDAVLKKRAGRIYTKGSVLFLMFCFYVVSSVTVNAAAYSDIDRRVTRRATPYGSAWTTNYGYNQPYSLDDLSDTENNGPNYSWLPAYHAGIDILIPNGTTLYSLTYGQVTRRKNSLGAVYIRTPQGGTLVYMHLSNIDVEDGDAVTPDTVIGQSGSEGTGSPHLHIEWLRNESDDPQEVSYYNTGTQLTWQDGIVGGTLLSATQTTSIPTLTYDLSGLNLNHVKPEGAISSGNVKITGVGFGATTGIVEISVHNPPDTITPFSSEELGKTINPTVSSDNWSDMEIRLNILASPLTEKNFVAPIKIVIKNSSSQTVATLYYPFQDVLPNAWSAEYITRAWKRGVISGKSESDYFKPNSDCNRAEFIKIVVTSADQTPSTQSEPTYTDVNTTDWFYLPVKTAWNLGWLDKTKTEFNPGNPILRAEASKIICLAAKFNDVIGSTIFDDVALTDWFAFYVMRLANREIVVGYNEGDLRLFKPGNNIDRAGAVKIAEKALHSSDYEIGE